MKTSLLVVMLMVSGCLSATTGFCDSDKGGNKTISDQEAAAIARYVLETFT